MRAYTSTAVAGNRNWRIIRMFTLGEILALLLKFIAGMTVNLFVELPKYHPGSNSIEYFSGIVKGIIWAIGSGTFYLGFHVILGLLIIVVSIVIIIFSVTVRERIWLVCSVIGWVAVTGAGINGVSFVNYGKEYSSLIMSIGFLVGIVCYAVVYHISREGSLIAEKHNDT